MPQLPPEKRVFEDLDWMESFALMVFIDLSLEAEYERVNERIHDLINEARKLLLELNLDPDELLEQWKKQGDFYVSE